MMNAEDILMTVDVPVEVTYGRVRRLLWVLRERVDGWWECGGYEYGGSVDACDFDAGGKYNRLGSLSRRQTVPLVADCAMLIDVFDPDCRERGVVAKIPLGPAAVRRGLVSLATHGDGTRWGEFFRGDPGYTTADVFLQLAVFGEARYGG